MSDLPVPTIRQLLARRFELIHLRSTTRGAPYLSMADECLRQMEWARRAVADSWHDTEGVGRDGKHLAEEHELTLAPEDWKP